MSKIVMEDVAAGYNLSNINDNFQKIATELNDKVLYRDNPVGEPNQMNNLLDMNSNRIINLPPPGSPTEPLRLGDLDAIGDVTTTSALLTTFNPSANIVSQNVQAAVEEVDTNSRTRDAVFSTAITKLFRWGEFQVEKYGAVADGVTDNTVAIQAAINAAAAAGGGVVKFLAGTYVSGQLTLSTNVHLQGIGCDHSGHFGPESFVNRYGTRLLMKAGLNPGNGFIFVPLFSHSNRIENMTIDANYANNLTAGVAIYVATGDPTDPPFSHQSEDLYLTVRDCGITGGRNFGLYGGPAGRGGRLINCYIYDNWGDGVRIQTSDWTIEKCLFGLNGNNLVLLGCEAMHVRGCDLFVPLERADNLAGTGNNVLINDSLFFGGAVPSHGIQFSCCQFDYAAQVGFGVFGSAGTDSIVLSDCRFNSASINHNNTYATVAIGPNVNNGGVTITNTEFRSAAPPNLPTFDILLADPNKWIRVSNNVHQTASSVQGITNSFTSLRLSTGGKSPSALVDSYLDGAGRYHGTQIRINSDNDTLQSQISNQTGTENSYILELGNNSNSTASFRTCNGAGYNAAATALYIGKNSATNRSINAAGIVGLSGADYAEWMVKSASCGVSEHGEVLGVDIDGKLTQNFSEAFTFVTRSTNPAILGNDCSGIPESQLEVIAFCGQVPLAAKYQGFAVGSYAVVEAGANDAISVAFKPKLSIDDLSYVVGKVIKVVDGVATIIVRVGS